MHMYFHIYTHTRKTVTDRWKEKGAESRGTVTD